MTKTENENKYLVTFKKPFTFEGKTFDSVDLSAIENLNTEQLCKAERVFERSGGVSALKEMNLEYAIILASVATGHPIEFFKALPAREGSKIKTRIGAYFFGSE